MPTRSTYRPGPPAQTSGGGGGGGTPTFVGCRVTSSVNIDISSATFTRATWDTETYDTNAIHEGVTNPGRMTVPAGKGGYWFLNTNVYITNVTAGKFSQINFYKNGSNTGHNTRLIAGNADSGGINLTLTTVLNLVATDYIEVFCYQDSGGTLTGGIALTSGGCFFEALLLGT